MMRTSISHANRLLDAAIRLLEREQREQRVYNTLKALRQLSG